MLTDLFWGLVNIVAAFFQTMVSAEASSRFTNRKHKSHGGFRSEAPSYRPGGGGPGGGGPGGAAGATTSTLDARSATRGVVSTSIPSTAEAVSADRSAASNAAKRAAAACHRCSSSRQGTPASSRAPVPQRAPLRPRG